MKILNIRRCLIFCFFMLLPIVQFYFSPYISIWAALGGGIAISVIVFISLFFIGMILGRAP